MIINMNGAKAPQTPSPVLQEKTVTPQTLPTVIGADEGYTGLSQVTVNPDTNLKAENIRSGKTIFGVGGSFAGETVYSNDIDVTELIVQGSYKQVSIPLFGNFMQNAGNIQGVKVESSQSDMPAHGTADTENNNIQTIFIYKGGKYSLSPFKGMGALSTYVPSGYYWYKCTIDIPEGDYKASFRELGVVYNWNGTCELSNIKVWWGSGTGATGSSYFISSMYDIDYNVNVENQTVTVTNGFGMVHLPAIQCSGYISGWSSFDYAYAGLALQGQFKITES